ncbi:unnamed protein product [Closterium sp. Naga37s-1]|nr:unnamed protein product [Closterium sp. Naga37s-1]
MSRSFQLPGAHCPTGLAKTTTAAAPSLSHRYSTLRQTSPRHSPASLPFASPGLSARARQAPSPTTARRAALSFRTAACCRSTKVTAATISEGRIASDYDEVEKQTQLLRILESQDERDRRTQQPPVEAAASTAPPRQSREAVCCVAPLHARWLSPALAAAVVASVLLPLPLQPPPQHAPPSVEQGRAAGSRSLGGAWGSAVGSALAMPAPFSGANAPLPSETFDNVPQSLSGALCFSQVPQSFSGVLSGALTGVHNIPSFLLSCPISFYLLISPLSIPLLSAPTEDDRKPRRIQKPKTPAAEKCLRKCVGTCIRGGAGAPGEGPINVERPIVVFKSEFRSRQYCLVECSEICNLLSDAKSKP